jgi:hypothetical protein
MLRRTALGVLAALAAASLAAVPQPASAAPGGGTVVPAVAAPGQNAAPAFTQIATTPHKAAVATADHGLLVCPPPANYDPSTTAP